MNEDIKQSTDVERRVRIPKGLWTLLEEVARAEDSTPKWWLNKLMRQIHRMSYTKPEVLGAEYEDARKRMEGQGRFDDDGTPPVDVAMLHRSDKVKSGFSGVYANGNGFRAMGIDPQTKNVCYVGTYPTAERAAEARRIFFLKNGMPYGRLAEHMETFKHSDAWKHASPELIRRYSIFELAQAGTPAEGLSEEDRKWETTDPLGHPE